MCHVAAPEWARSASHCHVSQPYWSMSAQIGPTSVPRGSQPVVHLISVYATWHNHRRPPHPTLCHMAQLHQATSTQLCHMAASQATTSPGLCHMAAYHEATSLFEIQQLDTWHHQSEPLQQLSATLHFPIGPPHHCGPHHTTR
jgi:hypothetical protein